MKFVGVHNRTLHNNHIPDTIPRMPTLFLSPLWPTLLQMYGPIIPPINAPIHSEIAKVQSTPTKNRYTMNEAEQMQNSAKVVVAMETFASNPPIIPPVLVTGPKPPPVNALLKAANAPIA